MPVPDRSTLPPDFVAYLDKQNAELADYQPPKPILPAPTTPQQLIDAAQELDRLIQVHRDDGSLAADLMEMQYRRLINAVLARTITEPVPENWAGVRWGDTDLYEPKRNDLERAWGHFKFLVYGIDESTPGEMRFFRRFELKIRQKVAEQMGVELDLTDDEWWQL